MVKLVWRAQATRYDRPMELLPEELRRAFPSLGTLDGHNPEQIPIIAKYFTPDSNWTWWAWEFDGIDILFGLVSGFEIEYGYFSLNELRQARGPLGLPIERDLHYHDRTLADVLAEVEAVRGSLPGGLRP